MTSPHGEISPLPPSTITYSLKWWRWGESNPRPKRLWPNIYACSPPLVSHPVRRRTGLSGRNRSVVRGPSARTERPRASPARLCRCGLAGVRRATSGPLIRPRERNRCSQLQFFPFFNEANENPRRAIWSPRIPSKPDHPQVPLRKNGTYYPLSRPPCQGGREYFSKLPKISFLLYCSPKENQRS